MTHVFPQPSFSNGAVSNLLCGGAGSPGENTGSSEAEGGVPHSPILPSHLHHWINASWEIWGIATIVLSVPDSHKTQNLSTGETLPQVLSTKVGKLRDLDGSVLPRIQKLVKQYCPGHFLVRVSFTFQPI